MDRVYTEIERELRVGNDGKETTIRAKGCRLDSGATGRPIDTPAAF
jgi:hypothetical protein